MTVRSSADVVLEYGGLFGAVAPGPTRIDSPDYRDDPTGTINEIKV